MSQLMLFVSLFLHAPLTDSYHCSQNEGDEAMPGTVGAPMLLITDITFELLASPDVSQKSLGPPLLAMSCLADWLEEDEILGDLGVLHVDTAPVMKFLTQRSS